MNAAGIITLAADQGVTLTADADRIIAKPATRLTAELRTAIRNHSAELLKVLINDNRSAKLNPDSDAHRDAADRRREVSRMPRDARQNDRRSTPSDPGAQKSAYAHPENIDPIAVCPTCGSGQWWQLPGDPWHCHRCEPMPSDAKRCATTITLDSHPPDTGGNLILEPENGVESIPNPKTAEALALLADNPGTRYALTSDDQSDPDNVIVSLAVRNAATCKLKVPRAKYDGLAILEMLERQNEQ